MWSHVLSSQGRQALSGTSHVVGEFEAHTGGAQGFAEAIHEERLITGPRLSLEQRREEIHCFWPQRTNSLLPAFSEQGHLCGRAEADGLRTQIQRLLDSRSRVVEQRKQHMITLPFQSRPIGLLQDRRNLLGIEVVDLTRGPFFRWDVQDFGALRDRGGFTLSNEPEEAAQGRQPAVPRSDCDFSVLLCVLKERQHLLRGEIFDEKIANRASFSAGDEPQEEPPGIPIGFYRVVG
jgi:hypothetical protein